MSFPRKQHVNGHPLVLEMERLWLASTITKKEMTHIAGVHAGTMDYWRRGVQEPRLTYFDAMLRALGYQLAIVPVHPQEDKP